MLLFSFQSTTSNADVSFFVMFVVILGFRNNIQKAGRGGDGDDVGGGIGIGDIIIAIIFPSKWNNAWEYSI